MTALFLGTALSISSVKIVAMVLMEIGAIRRDLGQLILATAILDDTLAWIIIAVISGIAAHGAVNFEHVGMSIGLTALFLAASLTVGRRAVARIIVWCNDNLATEVPVISAILLIMLAMALTTELIGVHTALGAFVAGILIGQSPILTEHIEGELRGFIIAFFSPVFFAVAGLGMDLRTLLDPALLGFTLAVILIASIGKFLGALAGGMLGGLNWLESLALATGLNARGSTEVIIATIGLSMGALSNQLFTMIVAMAVVTTMAMPPTLRWMMARVPLRDEELQRLDKEEAEQNESVPKMERALVYVDDSANGRLTATLAGMFAARQGVLTTVLEPTTDNDDKNPGRDRLTAAFQSVMNNMPEPSDKQALSASKPPVEQLLRARTTEAADAVEKEAAKGYSIAFVGIGQPTASAAPRFEEPLRSLSAAFDGPIAIVMNGDLLRPVARRAARYPGADRRQPRRAPGHRNRAGRRRRQPRHANGLARLRPAGGHTDAARPRETARHVGAGRCPSPGPSGRRTCQRPDRHQYAPRNRDSPHRTPRSLRPGRAGHLAAPRRDQIPGAAHAGPGAVTAYARPADRPLIAR